MKPSSVRPRLLIALVAALIAAVAIYYWVQLRPVPGEIAMGDGTSWASILSAVVAVCGTLTALFNALTAFIKMRSEK